MPPGWQREEGGCNRLITAIGIAARFQHQGLERRNAGDIDQQVIHRDRPDQGDPAPRIGAAEIRRHHGVGHPDEPLEEIVRVPRPAPQADIADAALVGRVGLEALENRLENFLQDRFRVAASFITTVQHHFFIAARRLIHLNKLQ